MFIWEVFPALFFLTQYTWDANRRPHPWYHFLSIETEDKQPQHHRLASSLTHQSIFRILHSTKRKFLLSSWSRPCNISMKVNRWKHPPFHPPSQD